MNNVKNILRMNYIVEASFQNAKSKFDYKFRKIELVYKIEGVELSIRLQVGSIDEVFKFLEYPQCE